VSRGSLHETELRAVLVPLLCAPGMAELAVVLASVLGSKMPVMALCVYLTTNSVSAQPQRHPSATAMAAATQTSPAYNYRWQWQLCRQQHDPQTGGSEIAVHKSGGTEHFTATAVEAWTECTPQTAREFMSHDPGLSELTDPIRSG
jgi:hypothetical protein